MCITGKRKSNARNRHTQKKNQKKTNTQKSLTFKWQNKI